jgi:hypothetical protein
MRQAARKPGPANACMPLLSPWRQAYGQSRHPKRFGHFLQLCHFFSTVNQGLSEKARIDKGSRC